MPPAPGSPQPHAPLQPTAALALVVAAAGFSLVVLGAGAWAGTYTSNMRIACVVAAFVATGAWLVVALRVERLRPASSLAGAFAAALLAFAISAALAWNVRLGIDFLGYAVLLTASYLLLARIWAVPGVAPRLTVLAAITCAAAGVVHVLFIVGTWISFWTRLGRLTVPPLRLTYEGLWLGSPNAFAAFQVLILMAALPGLLALGRRGRNASGALGVLVAVNVFLSASRGAWLGVALAVATCGVAWLLTPDGRSMLRRGRSTGSRGRAVISGGLAVVVLAVVVVAPALAARLGDFSGAGVRTAFLAASARMVAHAPLTGLGPGSWVPARQTFTDTTELDYYIPHAHNVPAQTAAEFGIVGILAAIVVVVVVLRLLVRAIRHPSGMVRASGFAALFAVVYLSGQQLVDAFIHQPAILAVLALTIGRLDALLPPPARETQEARWRGIALTATLLVAVVVATGAALWPEPAALAYEPAVTAADEGRWDEALSGASQAVADDPALAPYQFLEGISAAEHGDLRTARRALATAAALDDFPAAWLDLAAVQVKLGDPDAMDSLDRAIRLGQQQPLVAVAAADLYRQLGHHDDAEKLLGTAFGLVPSLASDPLWATPAWSTIANNALDATIATADPWTALLLRLESGRPAGALDRLPSSDQVLGRTVADAWEGDQAAFERLHALAQAKPLDDRTVGLCLRIAKLHDEQGQAPGWTCDGGWWFGVYPIARTGADADLGPLPGPAAYPHSLYAYRRPGPLDQLLSWMLHIHATPA